MPTPPDFTAGTALAASSLNSVGLWKVGSGTLSLTTTATNVAGVFSSTFKHYRVIMNTTARSTTNRIDFRYINGTTPTSSAYYNAGLGCDYASNTVLYYQRSNNDAQIFGYSQSAPQRVFMDIYSPNVATFTAHTGQMTDINSAYSFSFGGQQNTSNAVFTGFQLFTNTGTATVEYQVFGYKD